MLITSHGPTESRDRFSAKAASSGRTVSRYLWMGLSRRLQAALRALHQPLSGGLSRVVVTHLTRRALRRRPTVERATRLGGSRRPALCPPRGGGPASVGAEGRPAAHRRGPTSVVGVSRVAALARKSLAPRPRSPCTRPLAAVLHRRPGPQRVLRGPAGAVVARRHFQHRLLRRPGLERLEAPAGELGLPRKVPRRQRTTLVRCRREREANPCPFGAPDQFARRALMRLDGLLPGERV